MHGFREQKKIFVSGSKREHSGQIFYITEESTQNSEEERSGNAKLHSQSEPNISGLEKQTTISQEYSHFPILLSVESLEGCCHKAGKENDNLSYLYFATDIVRSSDRLLTDETLNSRKERNMNDLSILNQSLALFDRLYLHNQEANPINYFTIPQDDYGLGKSNGDNDYIDGLIKEYSKRKSATKRIENNLIEITRNQPSKKIDRHQESSENRRPTQETEVSVGGSIYGETNYRGKDSNIMKPSLGSLSDFSKTIDWATTDAKEKKILEKKENPPHRAFIRSAKTKVEGTLLENRSTTDNFFPQAEISLSSHPSQKPELDTKLPTIKPNEYSSKTFPIRPLTSIKKDVKCPSLQSRGQKADKESVRNMGNSITTINENNPNPAKFSGPGLNKPRIETPERDVSDISQEKSEAASVLSRNYYNGIIDELNSKVTILTRQLRERGVDVSKILERKKNSKSFDVDPGINRSKPGQNTFYLENERPKFQPAVSSRQREFKRNMNKSFEEKKNKAVVAVPPIHNIKLCNLKTGDSSAKPVAPGHQAPYMILNSSKTRSVIKKQIETKKIK